MTDEEEIAVGQLDVDSSLEEVLPRHARELVRVLSDPRSQVAAVRRRIEIEIRFDARVDVARACGQRRHRRDDGLSEILLQPFVAAVEKDLVPAYRSARRGAVLMTRERRRLVAVEEVARVHLAVAKELEA